jgi:hypothetical protein
LIGMECHVANDTMGILNNIEGHHDTTCPLWIGLWHQAILLIEFLVPILKIQH